MITFGYKNKFSGFIRAIVAIALGVVMIVNRESAGVLVAQIFAAFLLATGFVSFLFGFKDKKEGEMRMLNLNAIINIILGVLLFCFAKDIQNIVWVLIGLALFLFGLFHLLILFLAKRMFPISSWSFVIPTLVASLGLLLVFRPSFLGNALGLVAGISLVLYGVSELVSTLRMRRVMKDYEANHQSDDVHTYPDATNNLTASNVDVEAEDVDFEKVDEQ